MSENPINFLSLVFVPIETIPNKYTPSMVLMVPCYMLIKKNQEYANQVTISS